nr:ARID DNA-binding domain-containing protein [Tanacetum cinerariifolium]
MSHGSDHGGRPKLIHSRDQIGVSRKYLQRETPQRLLPWNRKKSLSPGCKEMLLMRMKEIEAFNALKNTANQKEERDRKDITQKENMARCYVCKMRGHMYWKCPNKKKNDLFKHKGIEKPIYKKAADKIKYHKKVKYPEKVHVITDYMIEGISEATWNGICKEGTFLIPNVHYTPKVTLNIRSHDLLEEQGYVVEIKNNKCSIHYMVGRKGKEKVQERSSTYDDGLMDAVTKHNRYLEKYFESVKPKEELSLVKGLEDLKWDKDDVQDYIDEEYISWNGSLLDEIPPRVGVMEINLLSLHKIIDNLGAYLCVTLGDKGKTFAERPWYEKKLGNEVGESSSRTTIEKEKDPQGWDRRNTKRTGRRHDHQDTIWSQTREQQGRGCRTRKYH